MSGNVCQFVHFADPLEVAKIFHFGNSNQITLPSPFILSAYTELRFFGKANFGAALKKY